ncbi:putative importin 13 [Aspergillus clavatus NRRL 1]|uniref:Importin 13, putative n=1 Tax=Aspergillus clavatus (strain ATCC 1007 / CBS 513.65 / DSM 816 / NCTC 3887 / NRRL 1 / QM 1276 / 107) TaxID=344612 RepID=A1CAQ0_ASPCL|nr:importin 13, putative [Aspergillus clavatus NRRL 1]EAW12818.1 importin 13, putative [Aspergillus clavatus NRRL 1]
MSADIPGPASDVQHILDEARALVTQLYDPENAGNPTKIKLIQERLQLLQKGPEAWLIANDLLSASSTDMRFFGALTFTVKINLDWQKLSQHDAQELLGRLIDHYVILVNSGERPLVIRKLATTLATIFLKPSAPWIRALWTLAASLAGGKYVSEEHFHSADLLEAVLPAMSQTQIVALLYFCNILAEDMNKWSPELRQPDDTKRASANIPDAFGIVEFILRHFLLQEPSQNASYDPTPGIEAINAYHLTSTTNHVIQCLRVPSLSRTAAQVVVELIDWKENIFGPDHLDSILEYITSHLGTAHVTSLLEGDFEDENMTFLELILAFSTLKQREMLAKPMDPHYNQVLTMLHALFKAPGYAAVDDPASPLLIEWWTEVADDVQEILFDSEDKSIVESAKQNLARAALDCFEKLKYPSPEELRDWSEDDRGEFGAFRRDVCDFLLAIYPILGVELIHLYQEQSSISLNHQDWRTFEAAVFCIAQLSEAVDGNQHADECLNAVFFSDDFDCLCRGEGMLIPDKARQTLVDMLGKYKSYFERTHALLPLVLTFLFASLEVLSCAPAASRSISYLCKSCRNALTSELPAFLDQFDQFRYKATATATTMEKVLEGIAAIIQALPTDDAKAQFLERILTYFHQQADLARDEAKRQMEEAAYSRALLVLRCIASIGKGLRTDGEIILDSNDGSNGISHSLSFWSTGPGAVSQSLIVQIMDLLITEVPRDASTIEAACDILKAGYTEKSGPYVFPPTVTVSFVQSIPLGSAGTDMVMGTASAFLASHSAHPERIREETVALILHVYQTFCKMQQSPELHDPEVANSGIDFLTRLLPKYHAVLFALISTPPDTNQSVPDLSIASRPPVLSTILDFTLLSLQGTEPLPLRSASQFWVGVLSLPMDVRQPGTLQDAINRYLPALCRILMVMLAGRCARSDIDHLCDVLRKVIPKYQGQARVYFLEALSSLNISTSHEGQGQVTPQEKERFVASLIAARGAKAQTNQVVRAFWIKCRGAGFNYAG